MTFCCFIKKKKVLILIYDSIFCMNCIHSVATTTDNRRYRSRKQNTSVFTRKTGNMGSVFLIQILSTKTKQIISAELITFLTAQSEVELKSLLMRVKEESEKAGLKLNIKKTKAMASRPITSWQIEEEKVEAVTDFLSWAPKSLWNGDCSHEIKSYFLAEMKAMTNLDRFVRDKKQGHHFANKTLCSQSYGFSSSQVWM